MRPSRCAPATSNGSRWPKAITFPTDAKLLHAAIEGLNRLAQLRQSYCYLRICASPSARDDGGALCHAKQFAPPSPIALLRTRLGRYPQYPPQNRCPGRARDRIGTAVGVRRANPFPAAAPAWVEVRFFPRARGRMHIAKGKTSGQAS
jgi:hypothetical protein